jgi:hypothetical protein
MRGHRKSTLLRLRSLVIVISPPAHDGRATEGTVELDIAERGKARLDSTVGAFIGLKLVSSHLDLAFTTFARVSWEAGPHEHRTSDGVGFFVFCVAFFRYRVEFGRCLHI